MPSRSDGEATAFQKKYVLNLPSADLETRFISHALDLLDLAADLSEVLQDKLKLPLSAKRTRRSRVWKQFDLQHEFPILRKGGQLTLRKRDDQQDYYLEVKEPFASRSPSNLLENKGFGFSLQYPRLDEMFRSNETFGRIRQPYQGFDLYKDQFTEVYDILVRNLHVPESMILDLEPVIHYDIERSELNFYTEQSQKELFYIAIDTIEFKILSGSHLRNRLLNQFEIKSNFSVQNMPGLDSRRVAARNEEFVRLVEDHIRNKLRNPKIIQDIWLPQIQSIREHHLQDLNAGFFHTEKNVYQLMMDRR